MWSFFSKDPAKDFNYEIGEAIVGLDDKSIWKLHKARKKVSGELYSVFICDVKNSSEPQMELAKASVKRLKTMRHPNILTYVDSLEGEKLIYLVTEYVEPLLTILSDANTEKKQLTIAWGIYQLARALQFLNNQNIDSLVHHNVCVPSVFVNQAGEWKLGGVEYMNKATETQRPIKIIPQLEIYDPPEKTDFKRSSASPVWSTDMWGFGCLIWEVFNGSLIKVGLLKSPGKIPKTLVPLYCELVSANPASRPSPADLINRCRADKGYLRNNFIDTLLFLEEIQIKEANEKSRFFTSLPQHIDEFPENICKYKILPLLLSALEYGGAGPAILTSLFKLGKLLSEDEYQKKIIPCVVKLFSSTDRATRAKLLQQIDLFVDHLNASVINSQLFPQLIHGFLDTNAVIREVTVKSILHLAPKLNYNNLNVELMKHFARLQAKDPEAGIRTNTTVCLGKIAHQLQPDTRKKVLITAFTRAMRDPFPPARNAGILALSATQKFYSLDEVSRRVLPVLCQMTIDPEKVVRDQVFKTIKGFLAKLERVSEDPSLKEEMESEVNAAATVTTDSALGWAGWAVSSITQKLYSKSASAKPNRTSVDNLTTAVSAPSTASGVGETAAAATLQASDASSKEHDNEDDNSDYEDVEGGSGWQENWGEMDSALQVDSSSKAATNDGWDTGWDDADFTADTLAGATSVKNITWNDDSTGNDSFANQLVKSRSMPPARTKLQDISSEDGIAWDSEWKDFKEKPTEYSSSREDRERRRLQKKEEVLNKRALKQGGPMKLGERRIQ